MSPVFAEVHATEAEFDVAAIIMFRSSHHALWP